MKPESNDKTANAGTAPSMDEFQLARMTPEQRLQWVEEQRKAIDARIDAAIEQMGGQEGRAAEL